MSDGTNSMSGGQNLSVDTSCGTVAGVSCSVELSVISPLQGTVMVIGPPRMKELKQNPKDMNGDKLGYQDRRFAIVTGAASGIGLACVQRLQDFDYELQLLDINPLPGSQIETIDLSRIEPRLRRAPDVLVVSHGVGGLGNSWEKVFGTNVFGVRNVVEEAVRLMLEEKKGGSIVLLASMTGPIVGNKGMQVANYAASKGAVVGYMRQRAVELAEHNIRINAVCPGPVISPMTNKLKERDPKLYDEFFGRCLLPGYTYPMDIADAVVYLAHSRRVTGQTLIVDGGYCVW